MQQIPKALCDIQHKSALYSLFLEMLTFKEQLQLRLITPKTCKSPLFTQHKKVIIWNDNYQLNNGNILLTTDLFSNKPVFVVRVEYIQPEYPWTTNNYQYFQIKGRNFGIKFTERHANHADFNNQLRHLQYNIDLSRLGLQVIPAEVNHIKQGLNLSYNAIWHISNIDSMRSDLDLSHNQLVSTAGLENIFRNLNLSHNPFTSVTRLDQIVSNLDISNNQSGGVVQIQGFNNLESGFNASHTTMTIQKQAIPKLRSRVNLSYCNISGVGCLEDITADLNLSHNYLTDTTIKALKSIKSNLNLSYNQLKTLSSKLAKQIDFGLDLSYNDIRQPDASVIKFKCAANLNLSGHRVLPTNMTYNHLKHGLNISSVVKHGDGDIATKTGLVFENAGFSQYFNQVIQCEIRFNLTEYLTFDALEDLTFCSQNSQQILLNVNKGKFPSLQRLTYKLEDGIEFIDNDLTVVLEVPLSMFSIVVSYKRISKLNLAVIAENTQNVNVSLLTQIYNLSVTGALNEMNLSINVKKITTVMPYCKILNITGSNPETIRSFKQQIVIMPSQQLQSVLFEKLWDSVMSLPNYKAHSTIIDCKQTQLFAPLLYKLTAYTASFDRIQCDQLRQLTAINITFVNIPQFRSIEHIRCHNIQFSIPKLSRNYNRVQPFGELPTNVGQTSIVDKWTFTCIPADPLSRCRAFNITE